MQNFDRKKKLFVISGSSGVGKGTVIEGFLKRNPNFSLSISYTTRAKREGEVDGVNYFFVSKEEFLMGVKNDEFLEWAEFSGNYYGTKKEFVQKSLAKNKNLILEIDTQGALQVKEKMSESVLIFIAPPSLQDLEFRLRNRKTETEEAIAKRLDFVKMEIQNSQRFDYRIVNDKVEYAIEELERIIKTEEAYER
ncbi:MAG: guanylate kinase [Candidatus Gastranaerophilales bacterium]|nr:guanylate kinase [Candidatus Gastranaerophilales bacterium]